MNRPTSENEPIRLTLTFTLALVKTSTPPTPNHIAVDQKRIYLKFLCRNSEDVHLTRFKFDPAISTSPKCVNIAYLQSNFGNVDHSHRIL